MVPDETRRRLSVGCGARGTMSGQEVAGSASSRVSRWPGALLKAADMRGICDPRRDRDDTSAKGLRPGGKRTRCDEHRDVRALRGGNSLEERKGRRSGAALSGSSKASPRSVVRERGRSDRRRPDADRRQWGRQRCRPHFCWPGMIPRAFSQFPSRTATAFVRVERDDGCAEPACLDFSGHERRWRG